MSSRGLPCCRHSDSHFLSVKWRCFGSSHKLVKKAVLSQFFGLPESMFAESTASDTLNTLSPSSDCYSVRPSKDWPELTNCDLTPRHESDAISSSSDLSYSCTNDNKLSLHDDEDVCSSMVTLGNITGTLHTLDNSIACM